MTSKTWKIGNGVNSATYFKLFAVVQR